MCSFLFISREQLRQELKEKDAKLISLENRPASFESLQNLKEMENSYLDLQQKHNSLLLLLVSILSSKFSFQTCLISLFLFFVRPLIFLLPLLRTNVCMRRISRIKIHPSCSHQTILTVNRLWFSPQMLGGGG